MIRMEDCCWVLKFNNSFWESVKAVRPSDRSKYLEFCIKLVNKRNDLPVTGLFEQDSE